MNNDWNEREWELLGQVPSNLTTNTREVGEWCFPDMDNDMAVAILSHVELGGRVTDVEGDVWVRIK